MSEKIKDGGQAFPMLGNVGHNSDWVTEGGMTLRDWFAGQALANPAICTGMASEHELRRWFGGRGGIARAEIMSAQAHVVADAMLAAREVQS